MSNSNFRVRKGLTVTGSTSGEVNIAAPAVAGSQSYTLPTAQPAVNGYVLASQTDGTMSWVDNSATGTTYNIDASSTTGGANLNLNGSDSSVDSVKFASSGATTVTRTDANTITISSTDNNTTYTQDASSTTGGANLNLVGSDSTTDSIKFASGTNVTVTATDANTITIAATDTNTTYTIDATSTTGGANFNLTGSDATTDTIKFEGSGATSVTRVDANTISISSTDNNTTYTIDASSTTGGVNFNLVGSDLSNDIIKFGDGTGINITSAAANDIKIALDPTANVTFNSVTTGTLKAADGTTALTLANSTGDVTANRYIQVNGNRILSSSGTPALYFDTSGNVATNGYLTVFGNIIRSWNGAAGATAITLSNTNNGDVTIAGDLIVGGNDIKASDGTTAATLSASTGDITYAGRLLSSASQTIRTGPNRTTGYAAISGATSEDILTVGIGASGVPVGGILVTNSGLATGSTAGRRQGILIRDYGGQEYNGGSTTPPQGTFMGESSRGTYSDPRALGSGQPLVALMGFSNAGTDLASGNTPYWTAQQYPTSPSFGLVTTQLHKGPWGSGAAVGSFTGSISGTTLTVSSMISGTITLGNEIRLASGADFPTTSNAYQVIAQVSGTPLGAGVYTLNASPGTVASTTILAVSTTLGSQFFVNSQPQNTPITTTSRVAQNIGADGITFRAQSASVATNIFSVNSWPTTVYAGTGTGAAPGSFVQGTNKTYFAISDDRTLVSNTLQVSGIIKSQGTGFTLQDSTATQVTGNNVGYNRVYGQWQYDATVTPVAANTAYAYPIAGPSSVTDFNNIATVGSTSRIIPGAAGMYKLQFSVQLDNADNGNDHIGYFWWRKNGTDVPSSMGQVTVVKGAATIAGWDNMISSANTTDYWELMYAVSDTNITLPYYAATAFGPAAASMFITLVPIGM